MPRGYLAPKECALLVGKKVASLILPVFFSISFQIFSYSGNEVALFFVSDWSVSETEETLVFQIRSVG